MTTIAQVHWDKAVGSLASARALLDVHPDSAASRAYYAAFHAVSAYFALGGESFEKHAQIRAALYRDLVNTGTWPKEFDRLMQTREIGDYDNLDQVDKTRVLVVVEAAARSLEKVRASHPDTFGAP